MMQWSNAQWGLRLGLLDGWHDLKNKVENEKDGKQWYASQACRATSKFTRHLAVTRPELAISPHGWVRWPRVVSQLNLVSERKITDNQVLTRMVTNCGKPYMGNTPQNNYDEPWEYDGCAIAEDSWEEPTVGGTTKKSLLFRCVDSDGRIIAIRSQHGMSATHGVSIAMTHVQFPMSALEYAPNFFHMRTDIHLPYIVLSGLNRGGKSRVNAQLVPTVGQNSRHHAKVRPWI